MFTPADHEALRLATDLMAWASEVLGQLMDQHPHDLNMQIIGCLCEAQREVATADKYMGGLK